MLVLIFTLQNHLKKIESALIDTIDDFKKNPHSPCSFNRLRESRIYWAAHVKTKFESLSILSISNILK